MTGVLLNSQSGMKRESIIRVASVNMRCFICDRRIRSGENHVIIEDERVCMTCGLPARRLRPIGTNAAMAAIK